MFAFTADTVQPAFVAPLFNMFVLRHYYERADVGNGKALAEMAGASTILARHTNIVMLHREDKVSKRLKVLECIWVHSTSRPGGQEIPIQCPGCGALMSYNIVQKSKSKSEGKCQRSSCGHEMDFVLEEGFNTVKAGEGGTWCIRENSLNV